MKVPIFNDEQRRTIARRIRKNRNVLGLSQEEVSHRSGVDKKVVTHIEGGKSVSAVSYKAVGQVVGLMFDDLLEFVSMRDEIQELIDDMMETDFMSPFQHATFAAQFNPVDPNAFAALHQSGLTMSGIEFSLFDVLIRYKGNLDREFSEYLKDMGLETKQRLYIHSFAVLYFVFGALDPWRRIDWRITMDEMMAQVCELLDLEEARSGGGPYRINPVTGETEKQEPNPIYKGTRRYRDSD